MYTLKNQGNRTKESLRPPPPTSIVVLLLPIVNAGIIIFILTGTFQSLLCNYDIIDLIITAQLIMQCNKHVPALYMAYIHVQIY